MQSLKNNINKYIHKTERLRDKLMVIRGERELWTDKLKIWNKQIQTTKHKYHKMLGKLVTSWWNQDPYV